MFLNDWQAKEIRQLFGSPVFVDSALMMRHAAQEALAVPAPFGLTVRYALKANPVRAIVQMFNRLGLQFDACSVFEAQRAIQAGVAPENIQLTAQELTSETRRFPVGVQINASSLTQIHFISKLSVGQDIGLRVNPGIGSGHHAKAKVGGPYAGFGIWHEDLDEVRRMAPQLGLTVTRLHAHVGSGGESDIAAMVTERLLEFAALFPSVQTINLGGGFGVARMPDSRAQAIGQMLAEPCRLLRNFARNTGRELRLEIEPGAYLVANAGVLLASVADVKRAGDNWFVVLNTGMTEILRPTLYGAQHPIRLVSFGESGQAPRHYTVIGHCCESGDVLTVTAGDSGRPASRQFAETRIGDIMLIGGVGAYCSSMCAKNYNSFPEAAEILLNEDNSYRMIRRRQTLEQTTENEL